MKNSKISSSLKSILDNPARPDKLFVVICVENTQGYDALMGHIGREEIKFYFFERNKEKKHIDAILTGEQVCFLDTEQDKFSIKSLENDPGRSL